jgi:2-polyprenyl-3-methyl-5-hydroxy-6-metoxy-1,4-benzoquinol methylase
MNLGKLKMLGNTMLSMSTGKEAKLAEIEILSSNDPYEFTEIWYEFADEDHFWMRWRFAALTRELTRLGIDTSLPMQGLDIGCGHGAVLRQLSANTNWSVDGCDLNRTALSLISNHNGRVLFYNIHDRNPDLFQKYDFLLLLDVIEHIKEPIAFIESAAYHLKLGGYVFVNVPALQSLYSQYDAVQGHYRRYDEGLLRAQLLAGGLEVCSSRYWGMTMVPLALARKVYVNQMTEPNKVIKAGFKPPSRLAAAVISAFGMVENRLSFRQPIGTSLLAVARRPS